MLFRNEQTQITGEQTKVIQLTGRSERHVQKLLQLGIAAPATALSDIGGHRECCAPHLTGQSKSFVGREWRRSPVNTQRQRMPFSPNIQFPKILHRSQPPSRNLETRMSFNYFFPFVSTCNLKPKTYNLRQDASNGQANHSLLLFVSTYNLQPKTYDLRQDTLNGQANHSLLLFVSTYNLQPKTYDLRQDTLNGQANHSLLLFVSTYNLQPKTYDLRQDTLNGQANHSLLLFVSTYNLQPKTYDLRQDTLNGQANHSLLPFVSTYNLKLTTYNSTESRVPQPSFLLFVFTYNLKPKTYDLMPDPSSNQAKRPSPHFVSTYNLKHMTYNLTGSCRQC